MRLEVGTSIEAVFGRIICFVYYDGPVSGLVETSGKREVYRFDMVAWDNLQDMRIFVFAAIPSTVFAAVTKRFSRGESPRWPIWVPHLDADLLGKARSAIPAAEADVVIASADALATVKLARRVVTAEDTKRVKSLVDAHASVDDWLSYLTSEQ